MRIAVTNILHNNDLGVIFSGLTEDGASIIVKSSEPIFPHHGAVYDLDATPYTAKNKWGKIQLRVDTDRLEFVRPSGNLCIPWLEGLRGIGTTRAKRLVDAFGNDVIEVLGDPDKIDNISMAIEPERPKIGDILAAQLQSYFFERKATDRTAAMEWQFYRKLEYLGVCNYRAAKRLWRLIGSPDAEKLLLRYPYLSVCVLPWKDSDFLGQRILTDQNYEGNPLVHPDRLSGACDAAWQRILSKGHTAATEDTFINSVPRGVAPVAALKAGLSSGAVVRRGNLLRAPGAAWLEDDLARRLRTIATQTSPAVLIPHEIMRYIRQTEHECDLQSKFLWIPNKAPTRSYISSSSVKLPPVR